MRDVTSITEPNPFGPLVADLVRDLAAMDAARLDAEDDRDGWRLLALQALEQLHQITMKCRRQSDTIVRLNTIVRTHISAPTPRRERRAA